LKNYSLIINKNLQLGTVQYSEVDCFWTENDHEAVKVTTYISKIILEG